MPKKNAELDRIVDAIDKLLVFELWALGVPQDRIAKTVGRQTVWVNNLLKGIPKGGQSHGRRKKAKKAD